MKKNYFRTKFNNKTLEKYVRKDFKYWNEEIQSKEVDTAFEKYLKGPYISKHAKDEVNTVFNLIEKGGLLGVATEAHEKWEVLEYMKRGYTLEEISNGVAHQEYQERAHAEARIREYSMYQFLHSKMFDEKSLPLKAFILIHPFWEIFIEDTYKVDIELWMMDRKIEEFGMFEILVRSEECVQEDIEKALKFFEKTGYKYKNRKKIIERAVFFNRYYHKNQ